MKLKLREKELPPVQLRLVIPAALKHNLDQYLALVRQRSGREVECRDIAVEMLAQFIESDREFKQWQKGGQASQQKRRLSGVQKNTEVNGQVSA